jgi:hypothetical protein
MTRTEDAPPEDDVDAVADAAARIVSRAPR